ncbi:hypothetical protein CLOACE_12210 [Clostridium acetireducens DSM 10703]|jgi:uncharacterized beta-barrel protein YwiB (DUF1934 family)|uniref:Beta-barrel protein YwiB n=1 Tax=Clostridium acetireducens DSM 10703 TaxID=1121290 RepID=A0A1E8EZ00_9CLOT|nr:DUF1934 domain-containing protein [Clostridium acetireducens]OFI06188.1 hypothetical protein CLOACE_12210 [Clostridium acetireducens DSM 10703]
MSKNAVISLLSEKVDLEEEKVEVITPGQFYKRGECYYVVYEETELSGMEGTKTTLKIAPENMSLIRFGNTKTSMNFKTNEESVVLYNCQYGAFELKIETKDLDIRMDDNGGEVIVDYNISILGDEPQRTLLKVVIKTQEN